MEVKKVIKNLKLRGFDARAFETVEELINEVKEEVKNDKTIGIGGSCSIDEIGLYDVLKELDKAIAWHWRPDTKDTREILKKANSSDVYFSSSNAITEDGKIVNIDGNGNRVSALIFGPKKVIVIAGINKICRDLDDAMNRVKTIACPKNAKRVGSNAPCVETGKCVNCFSKGRVCTVTTIHEMKPPTMEFKVFIVNKDLGY